MSKEAEKGRRIEQQQILQRLLGCELKLLSHQAVR